MPDPAPLRRSRAALVIKLVGAAAVAAAALYLGLSSCQGPPPPAPGDSRPVYLRPEFDRLVMGKTEASVVEAVGRPDTTSEDEENKFWHYKWRVRDPLTNATDTDVQVVFKDGKVVGINY
ncbi:hypothetical protein [Frigoriglobus tundricola]|uniref:Uncharacterized protein n=1 Tax=Frigoriglobus tundricola TaxID=2774151 RepID=A0A6M5YXS4_9BACT|nr:hypothetical protein [Frigoriglobus tundricola]QJW98196.1 hypothetical protein FTUN_5777 [Frigoriglobus tundricola]